MAPGEDTRQHETEFPDTSVREAWWGPPARLARWLLGAFTLVGGLTWVLINLHGPQPVLDIAAGTVLAAGGLVLLMPHRIDLPPRTTALVTAASALAGTASGLSAVKSQFCCEFAYVVDRGWPFTWLQRGAVAQSYEAARTLVASADWTFDAFALAADLLIWAYVGLLIMTIVVLVRRGRS
jgi:hypothetical protein